MKAKVEGTQMSTDCRMDKLVVNSDNGILHSSEKVIVTCDMINLMIVMLSEKR